MWALSNEPVVLGAPSLVLILNTTVKPVGDWNQNCQGAWETLERRSFLQVFFFVVLAVHVRGFF